MIGNGFVFIRLCQAPPAKLHVPQPLSEKVLTFNISLRSITLGETDRTRALRAKGVHPKAQSFRLSIIVHGCAGLPADLCV
jgi:hypothetical protein